MCRNYLVMSQYTRRTLPPPKEVYDKCLSLETICVDFYNAKFTQVRFSDFFHYKLLFKKVQDDQSNCNAENFYFRALANNLVDFLVK